MIQLPQEVRETGVAAPEKRALNQVIRYLRSQRIVENETVLIERTVNGVSIRAKSGSQTSSTDNVPVWG